MAENKRQKFDRFWKSTEVIREYKPVLYTFGDMRLPYIFAGEHEKLSDRAVVYKGEIVIRKPQIILPGAKNGPEFKAGFEMGDEIPEMAVLMIRSMGLPYSEVSNQVITQKKIEYGKLSDVLERFEVELRQHDDDQTGLIKGLAEGVQVSLMRYSIGLMVKSAEPNVKQFMEHLRRQRGEPISPSEKLTDDDIRKLFG